MSTDPTTAALAAQLERLSRQVERIEQTAASAAQTAAASHATGEILGQQLAALRTEVAGLAALAEQVGTLADRVTELATAEPDPQQPRLVSWFSANPDQAPTLLTELAQWVYHVLSWYPEARKVLSPCWRRHPAAVEALLALRAAWLAVYRSGAVRPSAAVDWHIRMLPGTIDLLRPDTGNCDELQHARGGSAAKRDADNPRPLPNPDQTATYADWWATTRAEDPSTPEPDLPARAPDTSHRPTPIHYGGVAYGSARPHP